MEKVRKHTGRKEEEEWWHFPILNRHFFRWLHTDW